MIKLKPLVIDQLNRLVEACVASAADWPDTVAGFETSSIVTLIDRYTINGDYSELYSLVTAINQALPDKLKESTR